MQGLPLTWQPLLCVAENVMNEDVNEVKYVS
jgi:hypothetical protein